MKTNDLSLPDTTKEAIQFIKLAGFPYIKVELEAHFRRRDSSNLRTKCEPCKATGQIKCTNCDGVGCIDAGIARSLGRLYDSYPCEACNANGSIRCEDCKGQGSIMTTPFDITKDNLCEKYIKDQLSEEDRKKLVYARFYTDGSVDSELTFTVAIEDVEIVPRVMKAFCNLKTFTKYMDTYGAGLHTAVLLHKTYPTSTQFPRDKINNFTIQVTKLLPALFFLASPDCRSRALGFRQPQISSGSKYSAIYTKNNTVLEYRVFETCYNRPQAFYDYVEVIARTLEFYHDPKKEVKQIGKSFSFSEGQMVHRFFNSPESLAILYRRLKMLKPKGKTMAELRKERGFGYSKVNLMMKLFKRDAQAKAQFDEFVALNPEFMEQKDTILRMLQSAQEYLPSGSRLNMSQIQDMVNRDTKAAAFEAFKTGYSAKNRPTTTTIQV